MILRITRFLFLIAFVCLSGLVSAQSNDDWMSPDYKDRLKTMKLNYRKPGILQEVKGHECFKEYPMLSQIITCAGNQLLSSDDQFLAFIPIYPIMTKEDSIFYQRLRPASKTFNPNRQHMYQMRNAIRMSLGEETSKTWRDLVNYYPSGDAKLKFNADTAVSFSIKLDDKNIYKGICTHLDALYLQKKDRGFVNFYIFYTDKGKKNLPAYMKAIEGILRYED
jgi:hypothetical protein